MSTATNPQNITVTLPPDAAQAFSRFLDVAGLSCFGYWGARTNEEAEGMLKAATIIKQELRAQGIKAGEGRA